MTSILDRKPKIMGASKVYSFLDILGRGGRNGVYGQTTLSTWAGAWRVYIARFVGDRRIFEVNLVEGAWRNIYC